MMALFECLVIVVVVVVDPLARPLERVELGRLEMLGRLGRLEMLSPPLERFVIVVVVVEERRPRPLR